MKTKKMRDAQALEEHPANSASVKESYPTTWGPRLFWGALMVMLLFFWWLLIYSHGVEVHH